MDAKQTGRPSSPPTQQNIDKVMRIMKCCCTFKTSTNNGQQDDEHIIKDAVLLSCGGNACRSCISSLNQKDLDCNYCNKTHSKEELKVEELASNPSIDSFIDTFSKDLLSLVKKDFQDNTRFLEDSSFQESVNRHIKLMDGQIDAKIEHLKEKLDEHGNELKKNLHRFQTTWKNLFPNEKINTFKQEFTQTANFHEIQDKCLKLKALINQCFDQFNSISFKPSSQEFDTSIIGKIHYPLRYDLNVVIQSKVSRIENAQLLIRGIENKNRILLTDYSNKDVKILSKDGTLLGTINPKNKLISPLAICTNKREDIFIGDCTRNQIYMFDSSFNFIKSFDNNLVKYPNSMVYDDDSDLIYVTDFVENFIYMIDSKTGELVKSANIDSPAHIRLLQDSVVVLSGSKTEGTKLTKGSNAVFVLNKQTLKLMKTIKLEKWLMPRGLYVDECQTIITTAVPALEPIESTNRYILVLNHNGQCLRSFELNLRNLNDFVLFNKNKLLACVDDEINIIEFE